MKPTIFNFFKTPGDSSYDVIRKFKRNLNKNGAKKIGHMGTLDPFAAGVLLVGINGACRINQYVHSYLPKTYWGRGKLGMRTATLDMTSEHIQLDESAFLNEKIASFPLDFLQCTLAEQFCGEYAQVPPFYSATKYQGRPLHQWAREGVEIAKDAVQREIYSLSILKYDFPYIEFRATVSSGTYIRTLFADMSRHLGTIGTLANLTREAIGDILVDDSIEVESWQTRSLGCHQILPFNRIILEEKEVLRFTNGQKVPFNPENIKIQSSKWKMPADIYWIMSATGCLRGLARLENNLLVPNLNFPP